MTKTRMTELQKDFQAVLSRIKDCGGLRRSTQMKACQSEITGIEDDPRYNDEDKRFLIAPLCKIFDRMYYGVVLR